ncbi:hypothetical protein VIGAN_09106100 [Vigna angularis var. angularis]|uniref:Uncharacterized protein n=1 Tax=Vigna angularis var. angularis TaxID=157739 RepID=A0A0S3SXR3_PHAAN|nr:hypothetical protein VIGAN_09106100 [Vigna angularis var. angularis]
MFLILHKHMPHIILGKACVELKRGHHFVQVHGRSLQKFEFYIIKGSGVTDMFCQANKPLNGAHGIDGRKYIMAHFALISQLLQKQHTPHFFPKTKIGLHICNEFTALRSLVQNF